MESTFQASCYTVRKKGAINREITTYVAILQNTGFEITLVKM